MRIETGQIIGFVMISTLIWIFRDLSIWLSLGMALILVVIISLVEERIFRWRGRDDFYQHITKYTMLIAKAQYLTPEFPDILWT